MNCYRPKDYIVADNFYGAVIAYAIEEGRVLTTVRYHRDKQGNIKKLSTRQATALLAEEKPSFLYHSKRYDVPVHGIPINRIEKIYRPEQWRNDISTQCSKDKKQLQALALLQIFQQHGIGQEQIGITGSILIGLQNDKSDIDIVIYGRENFHLARDTIKQLIGAKGLLPLTDNDWRESYRRRDCSIDFNTYIFHERRKFNKFLYDKTKVDISLVLQQDELQDDMAVYKKVGQTVIQSKVIDDSKSFDLPARYYLDNPNITELLCYTATYIGQALQGETVEAAGQLEINQLGQQRLIVGTSREAENEYIKVIA